MLNLWKNDVVIVTNEIQQFQGNRILDVGIIKISGCSCFYGAILSSHFVLYTHVILLCLAASVISIVMTRSNHHYNHECIL